MTSIQVNVDDIQPLTDSIIQLMLAPLDGFIDYEAGQYLQIKSGEEWLSYSIANAPLGTKKYELHIRHQPGQETQTPLFKTIKEEGKLTIRLPFGHCHLNRLPPNKPFVFVCAGTGFAHAKGMIEQLLADGNQLPIALFWGARSKSDLYMDSKVQQWKSHVHHFSYHALYPSQGEKLSLASQVIKHHPELKTANFVLSGPFEMVYTTRDSLIAGGVDKQQLFSDVFDLDEHQ